MDTTSIRNALTRRFGPLPAWVWLGVFAVAVILYRRWQTIHGVIETGASGEVVDSTATPGDPVTVSAGEGIYDPATGQLKTVTPEELPLDPVTLEPGQAVYNPNTGQVATNVPPSMSAASLTPVTGTKSGGMGKRKKAIKHPNRGVHYSTPHNGATKPHNARGHKHKPAGTPGAAAPIPVTGKTITRALGTVQEPRRAAPTGTPMMTAAPVVPRASAPPPPPPMTPVRVPTRPVPIGPVMGHVSTPTPAPKTIHPTAKRRKK